jgi:phosphoribosylpyrophosphate synthetase
VVDWEHCVVISPDEGGAKRAASLANDLILDFAIVSNRYVYTFISSNVNVISPPGISVILHRNPERNSTLNYEVLQKSLEG